MLTLQIVASEEEEGYSTVSACLFKGGGLHSIQTLHLSPRIPRTLQKPYLMHLEELAEKLYHSPRTETPRRNGEGWKADKN